MPSKSEGLTPAQWVKARRAERDAGNIGNTVEPQNLTVTPTTNGDGARNATTGSEPTISGKPLSPDCRDGNHSKCDGVAWDMEADRTTFCLCHECGHPAKDLEP